MTINTKFDDLTLVEHGLILKNGKNVKREISFSEIADIYVKTDKLKPVYKLGLILVPFLLVFLSVQYLSLEKVMFLGFLAVIPVFVKINSYKSYGLRIYLIDGTVFRKKISLRVKDENISIVNAVRRKQLNHYNK